ncbi:MAG TPA: MltR family transcriptional regulator [Steroidobacteraceae bacterium]|nr:MltR family transcriptional regulator [Steroidobacteraceae bacterium]
MREEDIKDLSAFLREFQAETDRGLPLVAAAVVDEKLEKALAGFFRETGAAKRLLDDNGPLATFSARIDACHALGLITDHEFHECNLIRKVRNEFAHKTHGLTFKTKIVHELCMSLKSGPLPGADKTDARMRFVNACVMMVTALYYRGEWVARERREEKDWYALGFAKARE